MKFIKEQAPSGKIIYRDVEAGEKREQLLKDCLAGKITQEEMRKKAKKLKYLYSSLPEGFCKCGGAKLSESDFCKDCI